MPIRWCACLVLMAPMLAGSAEVRVAVASNFTLTLNELGTLFEQRSGHHVVAIAGATGKLYAQIHNGAPFDVLLAADAQTPRQLEETGHAVAGSRFTYATGRLVLWSGDPGRMQAHADALRAADVKHIAIANPKTAPYGRAAMEVLRALKLWDAVQPKLVMGENVAQTLQFVATRNAQLGFIALAQILSLPPEQRGEYWEVPRALYAPITQDAVLLSQAPQTDAAKSLLDFLRSDEARAIMRRAGYE